MREVVWGGQEVEQEGRQEVRSQVRGGDNDKLCFSAVFYNRRRKKRDRDGDKEEKKIG